MLAVVHLAQAHPTGLFSVSQRVCHHGNQACFLLAALLKPRADRRERQADRAPRGSLKACQRLSVPQIEHQP